MPNYTKQANGYSKNTRNKRQRNTRGKAVKVSGYTRSDGVRVSGHTRNMPK